MVKADDVAATAGSIAIRAARAGTHNTMLSNGQTLRRTFASVAGGGLDEGHQTTCRRRDWLVDWIPDTAK